MGVVFSVPPRPSRRGSSERDVFASGFPDGTRRTPSAGNDESAASDRIVIHADEAAFARRMKFPANVSPAFSRIVSPGTAASMAGCRFVNGHPLAHTRSVAADARSANARQTRHTTTKLKRLRRTDTLPLRKG